MCRLVVVRIVVLFSMDRFNQISTMDARASGIAFEHCLRRLMTELITKNFRLEDIYIKIYFILLQSKREMFFSFWNTVDCSLSDFRLTEVQLTGLSN